MNDWRIREAVASDAGTVQELLLELAEALGKESDIETRAEDLLRHGFGDSPLFHALLAFEGERAVGLAIFFPEFSTWRGQPGVYVQDLYVAAAVRGKGLGRTMMAAVRQSAASWDAGYVRLSVYDGNPGAVAFYRRLGFETREDELVMFLAD